MANFIYDHAKRQLAAAALNLTTIDARLLLCMNSTTADTEKDKTTIGGFTTLDEFDGSGYSAGGVALTGEALSEDNTNHLAKFDADDAVFTALGNGSRPCQGAVLYAFASSVGASLPIAWFDTGGFPFSGNGSNVTFQVNAAGLISIV